VIRGAGLGYAYAFRTRVGFRLTGYNFKYSSVSDLGFRFDGVYRGGGIKSGGSGSRLVRRLNNNRGVAFSEDLGFRFV